MGINGTEPEDILKDGGTSPPVESFFYVYHSPFWQGMRAKPDFAVNRRAVEHPIRRLEINAAQRFFIQLLTGRLEISSQDWAAVKAVELAMMKRIPLLAHHCYLVAFAPLFIGARERPFAKGSHSVRYLASNKASRAISPHRGLMVPQAMGLYLVDGRGQGLHSLVKFPVSYGTVRIIYDSDWPESAAECVQRRSVSSALVQAELPLPGGFGGKPQLNCHPA